VLLRSLCTVSGAFACESRVVSGLLLSMTFESSGRVLDCLRQRRDSREEGEGRAEHDQANQAHAQCSCTRSGDPQSTCPWRRASARALAERHGSAALQLRTELQPFA
jgi:hypothetical protein